MSSRLGAPGQTETEQAAVLENWLKPVGVNPAFSCLAHANRVLMLQGPVGPFFDRVAQWLLARGCQVERVVFQGGDEQDCQAVRPIRFTGQPAAWPAFLAALLSRSKPDCIVLFGQARLYHKVALERARATDLPVVVMEEGYFRPGFVTMELGGVNGYSTTLDRFVWTPGSAEGPSTGLRPHLSDAHFQKMALHAARHYASMHKHRDQYPHYQHHRSDHIRSYAWYWTKSWFRKGLHRSGDLKFQHWLFQSGKPYFFVPMQLEGDSQLTHHSPFANNAEFVLRVLHSFASHAPRDSLLVFKQHPHARGGPGHDGLIRTVAASLGIGHRVHHMLEGDTPDLAEYSAGTVLINSTVGLQALERGAPLMALGETPYRRPDLTFPGELDDFWRERQRPNPDLTGAFLAQVKNLTQAPASVYAWRSESLGWSGLPLN